VQRALKLLLASHSDRLDFLPAESLCKYLRSCDGQVCLDRKKLDRRLTACSGVVLAAHAVVVVAPVVAEMYEGVITHGREKLMNQRGLINLVQKHVKCKLLCQSVNFVLTAPSFVLAHFFAVICYCCVFVDERSKLAFVVEDVLNGLLPIFGMLRLIALNLIRYGPKQAISVRAHFKHVQTIFI